MTEDEAPGEDDTVNSVAGGFASLSVIGVAAGEGGESSSGASNSKKDPRTIARGYAICTFLFGFFVVPGSLVGLRLAAEKWRVGSGDSHFLFGGKIKNFMTRKGVKPWVSLCFVLE